MATDFEHLRRNAANLEAIGDKVVDAIEEAAGGDIGQQIEDALSELELGAPSAIEIELTKSAHGFEVGEVIAAKVGSGLVLAANEPMTDANVIGVVSEVVDTDNFKVVHAGLIEGVSGLTAGTLYYLDGSGDGTLTTTRPTTNIASVRPVLVALSATTAIVYSTQWIPADKVTIEA